MKRLKHGIYAIVVLSLTTGLLTCKGAEEIFAQVQENVEGARAGSRVLYDGNGSDGGTVPVDANGYTEGATVTVSGPGTMSRIGHTYTNWNTASDGDGIAYAPGATFAIGSEEVTLYAQWSVNQYMLSYDLNGGTGTVPADTLYNFGSQVPTDDSSGITLVGYNFTEWNTESNGTGTAVPAGALFTVPASDTTLFAQWVIAPWGRTVTAGAESSAFYCIAVDPAGYVYGGGFQQGGTYTYGPGVSVAGTSSWNIVLVKYDVYGTALWARSVTAGVTSSAFQGIAVGPSGDVYAAGWQGGNGIFTYGPGVSATGTYADGSNVVLVKYNSSGTAQWAHSVTTGASYSTFQSVAVDTSGNVYAVGRQKLDGTYTYGTGVSTAGSSADDYNAVLVKYNPSGVAQWARSVTSGADDSTFYGVAVDASGYVYAAGFQEGTGTYTYDDRSVSGASAFMNAVLVKYNASGDAQWARSVTTGTDYSAFRSVAVDASGNLYAAGQQNGIGSYTYGPGASAAGAHTGDNIVLVKYNSSGTAQWARSVTAGASNSLFNGVAVDASGNVYAAGQQRGTGTYTYGPGVNTAGTYAVNNVVLVKYDASGNAQWARSVAAGGSNSSFDGVGVDASGHVYAAGEQSGSGIYTYGPGVDVSGASSSRNVVLVKYVE